jgi:hypothetical protein
MISVPRIAAAVAVAIFIGLVAVGIDEDYELEKMAQSRAVAGGYSHTAPTFIMGAELPYPRKSEK